MRQMLDNMYLTNNNRVAVQDGQVSMDDLLTNRPGGIVRTKQPPQKCNDAYSGSTHYRTGKWYVSLFRFC